MGLIVGRKAFQRPMAEGAALIHSIQDVYLDNDVTIDGRGLIYLVDRVRGVDIIETTAFG